MAVDYNGGLKRGAAWPVVVLRDVALHHAPVVKPSSLVISVPRDFGQAGRM